MVALDTISAFASAELSSGLLSYCQLLTRREPFERRTIIIGPDACEQAADHRSLVRIAAFLVNETRA
jgi:hypothetical protein